CFAVLNLKLSVPWPWHGSQEREARSRSEGVIWRRTRTSTRRNPPNRFEPAGRNGSFWRQRMTDTVGTWQTRVQMGTALPHQRGEPVAREGPKIVTPLVALGADVPAEARIAGIDGVGVRGQFANPAARQRLAEPYGGLFPSSLHD